MSRAPQRHTRPRVVVVGHLVTDVLVLTPDPVAADSDTDATITQRGGGAAANTACWLVAAGIAATLVARVGDDEAGRARIREIRQAGVDPAVAVDRELDTGTIMVLVGSDGGRTMLTDRGAGRRLSVEDVAPPALAGAAHLHLSGYLLFDDSTRAAARHAVAQARAAGMTVSVDAASSAPLARVGATAFLSWTGGADLLLANADEAEVLTGTRTPEEAAHALSPHFGAVVVKVGAAGALWTDGSALVTCPAEPATVRDTTGAGDAFAAGLLAAWLAGSDPADCLAAGASVAARAVAVTGGRPTGR